MLNLFIRSKMEVYSSQIIYILRTTYSIVDWSSLCYLKGKCMASIYGFCGRRPRQTSNKEQRQAYYIPCFDRFGWVSIWNPVLF